MNVYNTTFNFSIELKKFFCPFKVIDDSTEKFRFSSDINYSIELRICTLYKVYH